MHGEHGVGCPYCNSMYSATLSGTLTQVECSYCKGRKQWHEGLFRATLATVRSKKKRSIRRGGPYLWTLRVVTDEGEKLIELATSTSINIASRDIVTLSYPKCSRGIVRKKWDGTWKAMPKVLVNNTLHQSWKL